jgi:PAS domain S-box-containing protein
MIRILHIDDSRIDMELTKNNLSKLAEDLIIEWAESAKDALELLAEGKFDCILCDCRMPKIDGVQLLHTLRRNGNDIPFIFLTGHGNEEIAAKALRAGADDYYTKKKGFAHYESLVNSIRRAVEAKVDRDERRKDLEAPRTSEEKFSKAFKASPESLTISSLEDGRILEVNESFERISGYSRQEAIGKTAFELNLWKNPEDRKQLVKALQEKGFVFDMEIEYRRKSGEIINGVTSMELFEQDGKHYIIGVTRDITERKHAEEELKLHRDQLAEKTRLLTETNKELETFAYTVSHDLKAPLRHIEGYADLLTKQYSDMLDKKGQGYIKTISDSSKRMKHLVEDILRLSRASSGEMHKEKLNLSALATYVAKSLRRNDPDRQVEFKVTRNLKADGDPRMLTAALENLLGNAWKFTIKEEKPIIRLGTRKIKGERTFYVSDNGVGFDPDKADKLFQPFQRLHKEEEFIGSGIGLATVQRIIRRHGGSIWAEGEVGQGATFYFTLK